MSSDKTSYRYNMHAALIRAEAALHEAHLWSNAIGGMPDDPRLVDPDGNLDAAALTGSPGFAAAIDTITAVAAGGRTVLLCAEENPAHCHRSRVLAPAFLARGHQVLHLRHDGTARGHQDELLLE